MKKIICSALFLILASCQTQEQTLTPIAPINQAIQSSSNVAKIKADPSSFFPVEI